jgi:pilus assembly protein CpaF
VTGEESTLDVAREQLVRELPARAALGLAPAPWAADLCGTGPLEPLLADERVTEIMVNGARPIHVEIDGRLVVTDLRFRDAHHLRSVVERLVAVAGRRLDDASPTADAVLPDGSRLNAVLPPIAVEGPHLTIRRPRARALHLSDLVQSGSVSRPLAAFLHAAVVGRCNVLVSGGTGAGKTTLLAALCALVPAEQRIVTIEDVAELRIEHPHVVAQQCRDAISPSVAAVDMRALVRNTLRMRPDRIVVGEVRGPEAAEMLAAMNTGHPGSMSTVHANSALDALSRVESMLAVAWPSLSLPTLHKWVTTAVDVVVHCERDAAGTRAVAQIVALDDAGPHSVHDAGDDACVLRRPPARCLDRMARHGVDFPPELLTRANVA